MPAATQTQDRSKALATALAQIDKSFGKGSVMRLGDDTRPPVSVIPTGSVALDVALGVGGLPRGRIIEVYGPESSGKTTVALHAVASAQAAGGNAAFIDAEHALDPVYAQALGVDIDNLLVSQPDTGEQALEITDMLVRSGGLDIIVIDSVAALVPKAEIEGEMGDSHVGLQARLMSQALRKITGALSSTGTTAIFINQLREKIGVFFGNPETTTGGKALKFYSSVRLDVRRTQTLKDGDQPVGNRTRVKVVKNKMAPPFKQAEFDILYGQGISREGSLLDLGVEHAVVRKSGAWFTYGEDQLGQGKENARAFLKDNPQLAAEIEEKILAALGIGEPGRRAREEAAQEEAQAALQAAGGGAAVSPQTDPPAETARARGRGRKTSREPAGRAKGPATRGGGRQATEAVTAAAAKPSTGPAEATETIFGEDAGGF
ncbi:recombinase RecA [Actinomyces sp. 2119]|uniref:recombinase RecA n=1 Tax=Actinomyces sp. 2119 TaxID=2321393 RepID=UPI000E6D1F4D|nr:recombinase RecA [Actinomyces sp. 2119]RJF42570.1 recombinase RecA [Actinomyces sp. 2119]